MHEARTPWQLPAASVPSEGTQGDKCHLRPSSEGHSFLGGQKPRAQTHGVPARWWLWGQGCNSCPAAGGHSEHAELTQQPPITATTPSRAPRKCHGT